MLPSDLRLLEGIRDVLRQAAANERDWKAAIAAAQIGLNELILRTDRRFFDEQLSRGFRLMAEAEALAPQPALQARKDDRAEPSWDAVHRTLQELVTVLSSQEDADPRVKSFLSRVVEWEDELPKARAERHALAAAASTRTVEELSQSALQSYLRAKFPHCQDLRVLNVNTLPGGFSKTTILFDIEDAVNGVQSLVIRAEQPLTLIFDSAKVVNEYRALRLAHRAGVRVAEPLWLEPDSSLVGGSFLVSRKVSGRNIGTAVSVDEKISDALLLDLVEQLVRIHRVPIDPTDSDIRESHLLYWSRYRTVSESARAHTAYWREQTQQMGLQPSPLIARALDWLERHAPAGDDESCLVHCDYGLHNILVDADRVSCILDWESATIGDPAEDLSWFIDALKGRTDRQHILDLYAQVSGKRVPSYRVRYFDVITSLKYAVICENALSVFQKHPQVPVSACQLGLLYRHSGTGQLNRRIEMAESEIAERRI